MVILRRFGATALLILLYAMPLAAQVIERNLPPVTPPDHTAAPKLQPVPADQDATPIGPRLRSIIVLGETEPVHLVPVEGVHLNKGPAQLQSLLKPLLGKPISLRLIAEIRTAITRAYRAADRPFISVGTPEQELTNGAIQFRVIEFRLNTLGFRGKTKTPSAYIADRVRLRSGDTISAHRLGQDLDWLNRYRFRQTNVLLTPGPAVGTTDLVLTTTDSRPWQVYGGVATSDAPSTGDARMFVGAIAGGLVGRDSIASLQVTRSTDALSRSPLYVSAAGSVIIPLGPRQQVEVSADIVRTRRDQAPFTFDSKIWELALGYRFALPGGDLRLGVEAKRQDGLILFGGAEALKSAAGIYQFYVGYGFDRDEPRGHLSVDLEAHAGPGGVVRIGSEGPPTDRSAYGYLRVSGTYEQRIGRDVSWSTQLIAQVATRALPSTEQAGLGAASLVRGYTFDDGAFDTAALVRNELGLRVYENFKLHIFVDAGLGRNIATDRHVTTVSGGAGATQRIGRFAGITIDVAHAFTDAIQTRAGDWRVIGRLSVSF